MLCAPPMLIDEPKPAVCVASAQNYAANAVVCDSVESPAKEHATKVKSSLDMLNDLLDVDPLYL
tara:strand:- start:239 stop:430 length:192 start_codon:yes stop_codon:yes gene_type:complete